ECREKRILQQGEAGNSDLGVWTDSSVPPIVDGPRSHGEPSKFAPSGAKPMFKIEAGAEPGYDPQAIEAGLPRPANLWTRKRAPSWKPGLDMILAVGRLTRNRLPATRQV